MPEETQGYKLSQPKQSLAEYHQMGTFRPRPVDLAADPSYCGPSGRLLLGTCMKEGGERAILCGGGVTMAESRSGGIADEES